MTRVNRNYERTPKETLSALIACHDAAITEGGELPMQRLLQGLPHGPLSAARLDAETGLIAFRVKDRNERFVEPDAFFILRCLTVFDIGALHIDTSERGSEGFHYIEVTDPGITAQRLFADAQKGEVVKLKGDHHDLSAGNLRIVNGRQTTKRGRREALAEALKAYDQNAEDWGLKDTISREGYRQLIRDAFRLYDIRHGHHYFRPIA